jgi:hypothetical protein
MALEKLSESHQWLLCHWGIGDAVGKVIQEAYERLQIETGLPGNIFLYDYTRFECLATHSWFKTFWQYLDHFDVKFEIDEELTIPPVRERDQVFMDLVTKLLP